MNRLVSDLDMFRSTNSARRRVFGTNFTQPVLALSVPPLPALQGVRPDRVVADVEASYYCSGCSFKPSNCPGAMDTHFSDVETSTLVSNNDN